MEADTEESTSKSITGEAIKVIPKGSTTYLMLITIIGILIYLIISVSKLKRKLLSKRKIL